MKGNALRSPSERLLSIASATRRHQQKADPMGIPIGDEPSGSRTPPYVVYGLIALNALVWLLQLQLGESFTNGWSAVPYELTHGQDLTGTRTIEAGGEAFPVRLYPGPTPIYLTLLSAMFMHGSWLHILGNM